MAVLDLIPQSRPVWFVSARLVTARECPLLTLFPEQLRHYVE